MLIWEALRAWGDLGASMRRQLVRQPREAKLVAYAIFAGLVGFLCSVPAALDQAAILEQAHALDQTVARDTVLDASDYGTTVAVLSGRLFGALFLAPVVFYIFAAIAAVVGRMAGLGINPYQMRLAFFWSLVVSTPLLVVMQLGARFSANITGTLQVSVFVIFCWVFSAMIAEASAQKQRMAVFFALLAIASISGAAILIVFGQ